MMSIRAFHIWDIGGWNMSRTNRSARSSGRMAIALLSVAAIMAADSAMANGHDMSAAPPIVVAASEAAPVLPGVEDGARALFCEEIGFLSFVRGIDERLRSPQFPGATVQAADGFIVLTATLETRGIAAEQSSYLTRGEADRWTFTGFRGTEPVADRCTDITKDLAGSFRDLALAAAWGLPEVQRRVALFDALEDDLRTRLELAELERDALLTDADTMRQQVAGLTTELVTARMAICEIATQTQGLLTQASFGPEGGTPPAGFAELLAEASTMSECIAGTTMTVGTSQEP